MKITKNKESLMYNILTYYTLISQRDSLERGFCRKLLGSQSSLEEKEIPH